MGCKFSKGDIVVINDTAEVLYDHRGETAIVVETVLSGVGDKIEREPIKYRDKCLVTVKLNDDTIEENVDESELSPRS